MNKATKNKTMRLGTTVVAALLLTLAACSSGDDGASVRTTGCDSSSSGSDDCASGSGPATGSIAAECVPIGDISTATATVDVTLDEWLIEMEPRAVPAGLIGFVVENRGEEPHELVVVKGVAPADLPLDADGALDEDGLPVGAFIGEIEGFPGGDTCDGVFELEAGEYTLVCNIVEEEASGETESHLHEGMVNTLRVS